MSKRLLPIILAVLVVLAIGGGASSASGGFHDHYRFHGTVADAEWATGSPTDSGLTYVGVTVGAQRQLYVSQYTAHFDSNHDYLGWTQLRAITDTGFTASIQMPLRSAAVNALNLPATRCDYDSSGIGSCVDTTITLHANWMGEGSIARETLNDRYTYAGFKSSYHFNGTGRNAMATGAINEEPLTANNLYFAGISRVNEGETDIWR